MYLLHIGNFGVTQVVWSNTILTKIITRISIYEVDKPYTAAKDGAI